jgi:hypothetical protein
MGYEGNLGESDLSGTVASYKEILSETRVLRENPAQTTGCFGLSRCDRIEAIIGSAGFGARVDGK